MNFGDPLALSGIDLVGSALVPEGQILNVEGRLLFHSRKSYRERWRRPHGRSRPARRRRSVKVVEYHPDLDRIIAASEVL